MLKLVLFYLSVFSLIGGECTPDSPVGERQQIAKTDVQAESVPDAEQEQEEDEDEEEVKEDSEAKVGTEAEADAESGAELEANVEAEPSLRRLEQVQKLDSAEEEMNHLFNHSQNFPHFWDKKRPSLRLLGSDIVETLIGTALDKIISAPIFDEEFSVFKERLDIIVETINEYPVPGARKGIIAAFTRKFSGLIIGHEGHEDKPEKWYAEFYGRRDAQAVKKYYLHSIKLRLQEECGKAQIDSNIRLWLEMLNVQHYGKSDYHNQFTKKQIAKCLVKAVSNENIAFFGNLPVMMEKPFKWRPLLFKEVRPLWSDVYEEAFAKMLRRNMFGKLFKLNTFEGAHSKGLKKWYRNYYLTKVQENPSILTEEVREAVATYKKGAALRIEKTVLALIKGRTKSEDLTEHEILNLNRWLKLHLKLTGHFETSKLRESFFSLVLEHFPVGNYTGLQMLCHRIESLCDFSQNAADMSEESLEKFHEAAKVFLYLVAHEEGYRGMLSTFARLENISDNKVQAEIFAEMLNETNFLRTLFPQNRPHSRVRLLSLVYNNIYDEIFKTKINSDTAKELLLLNAIMDKNFKVQRFIFGDEDSTTFHLGPLNTVARLFELGEPLNLVEEDEEDAIDNNTLSILLEIRQKMVELISN